MSKILEWDFDTLDACKDSDLFLEDHPEYPAYLLVNAIDPHYIHTFHDLIGPFQDIHKLKVEPLLKHADDEGIDSIFYLGDLDALAAFIDDLDTPYPLSLEITLKKFQLQGFNYCKNLKSDIINWSTGTGKSVYAVAKAKYLLATGKVDRVVVVSKGHNKINWQRQFKDLGDLDAVVAEAVGNNADLRRSRRNEIYQTEPIFIINYEKLRFRVKEKKGERSGTGDGDELVKALTDQRVYFIWDEMPTRLKNITTASWKGAKKVLACTEDAYQSMLSATLLENSPEDVYACVKLLDPNMFGTLSAFRNSYAKSFNPFQSWQVDSWDIIKLKEMGMKLAHMTHQANKYRDPDIAAEFPEEHWEDILIDMSEPDRILYKQVEKQLAEEFDLNPADNILPKLLVLQLICNNAKWLEKSDSEIAKRIVEKKSPTDTNAAKLQTLKDLLEEIEGKVVLFSMYNDFGSRALAEYVQKWGHSYVLYDGTPTQMQVAQDRFKDDPDIKIFISSDKGSDSINLQQATTVINYDLPWKYSTLLQRVNRINRITSEADHVWYYNLIVANSMEERKMIILERKRVMAEAIDNPTAEVMEAMLSMTVDDYRFILTGE